MNDDLKMIDEWADQWKMSFTPDYILLNYCMSIKLLSKLVHHAEIVLNIYDGVF